VISTLTSRSAKEIIVPRIPTFNVLRDSLVGLRVTAQLAVIFLEIISDIRNQHKHWGTYVVIVSTCCWCSCCAIWQAIGISTQVFSSEIKECASGDFNLKEEVDDIITEEEFILFGFEDIVGLHF